MSLPVETVTFLFTDIEGSTRLWESQPEAMQIALARHDVLLRNAIEQNGGTVFKTMGDAFCAVFPAAPGALRATLGAQLALLREPWPAETPLRVRMALHTGAAENRDSDYFGPALNRVARLLATGHGGQTILSQPTQEQVGEALPDRASLRDLGSHRLKDLAQPEQVYQVQHPDLPDSFPPLKSLSTHRNNLPQQVTSFIGREKEQTEIQTLLEKTRLLTLTGSGGSGKSRLALQAAADLLERFPDGAFLVELAPLADPHLVAQTVANTLGVKEAAGKPILTTLSETLQSQTLLLLLDNCEHVLDVCATLVDTLVRTCPNLKVLATSREGLGIAGETNYRIPSLSSPDPRQPQTPETLMDFEAVRLFVERTRQTQPDFEVLPENAGALASICHRLDGIPLAIELAAARMRSLSAEEINSKLDQRFRLLTGGSRTALPRQQTLRSLIDWSYDLLHSEEKQVLECLSVFAGGWTLEAAEVVCADRGVQDWEVLDYLTSLTDKSLVLAEQLQGQTRYRLLETIRQYSRERLLDSGHGEEARLRHRDYFLAFVEEAEPGLIGPEQVRWLDRLEEEAENIRAGIEVSLQQEHTRQALQFCQSLYLFWRTRGHLTEGREWCALALALPADPAATLERAGTLRTSGGLAMNQGDYRTASEHLTESVALCREAGNTSRLVNTLMTLVAKFIYQGEYAEARPWAEEALSLAQKQGETFLIATALMNLGNVLWGTGDYAAAAGYHRKSLPLFRDSGDKWSVATVLNNLGLVLQAQADPMAALACHEESLAIREELGDRWCIALSLSNLANIAIDQKDYSTAHAYLLRCLPIYRELDDRSRIAATLRHLALLASETDQLLRAARLWGAAEALRAQLDESLPPSYQAEYEAEVAAARAVLNDDIVFDAAWQEGGAFTLEQAVALALETSS
jgi:predicted ATPase/class 3 adenylate cyclase